MKSEDFIRDLDLSDSLIVESNPNNFQRKAVVPMKKILAIGLAAAAVLLLALGNVFWLPTRPGGDLTVQNPPIASTDTQTDSITQNTTDTQSDSTEIWYGEAPSLPHFHYQENVYSASLKVTVEDLLPSGFELLGTAIPYDGCLSGDGHGGDFHGNVDGVIYMNAEKTVAYVRSVDKGDAKYRRFEIDRSMEEAE